MTDLNQASQPDHELPRPIGTPTPETDQKPQPRSGRALFAKLNPEALKAAWVGRLVMIVLAALLVMLIGRLIRRIDWAYVWAALSQLSWWQPVLLFVIVLLRQVANGAPLMYNIPGTSLRQAVICDMAAATMGVLAPPPSESGLRIAMFRSWGTAISVAVSGAVLNSVTFFLIRFSAPLLGFMIVAVAGRPLGFRWLDVFSLLIAAVLLVGVLLVVRSTNLARWVGRQSGRLVRLVRPGVDPEAWADTCADFRQDVAGRFGYGFPRSLLANLVMLVLDVLILFLSLRFVGLTPEQLPAADILIAHLFAFPLTAFPMSGIGVMDAAALASMVEAGGPGITERVLAGLIIWRVFTVLLVFGLGLIALVVWRRSGATATPDDEPAAG
ncbi:hypothetical protein [Micropruina sp.]|uniref:hypothetical protein n=1 Tax=Micropruina sp. TaxID=2737536 RepID=UPI0039E60A5D